MKYALSILIYLVSFEASIAQNCTLSGKVVDKETAESLGFVDVIATNLGKGTTADLDGKFIIKLPCRDSVTLKFRMIEYAELERTFYLDGDKELIIQLESEVSDTKVFGDVNVYGEDKNANVSDVQVGKISLDMDEVKRLPAFLGEVDVIKTLQLTPGVSSAAEGTQGFYVRGGSPDQNLVLLDGTHVYNASHLFGFFSVFNVDAINNVELIKAGIPAKYGGRLSSVLNVNSNVGSNQQFGAKGGIGLISSRLTVDGPLQKDKGSFLVSGRRTYLDVVTKPFIPEDGNFSGTGYYFYDLNVRLDYKISPKDKIYFSGYYGKDDFTFSTGSEDFSVDMPWGNGIATLKWNHVFNEKWLLTSSASLTDYQFAFNSGQDEFRIGINSGIRDYNGSMNLRFTPNPRHEINAGVDYVYHIFTPISVSADQGDTDFDVGDAQRLLSHESAVYISDEFSITENWEVYAGLRYSFYHQVGPFTRYVDQNVGVEDSTIVYPSGEIISQYQYFEPRISTRFLIDDQNSIKMGWNRNAQYVHLASLSAISLPTDIWFPTTDKIAPQVGWQGSLGYFRNFKDNSYESSVEVYYKSMNNLVSFKEGVLPQENAQSNTDNLLTQGEGYSYGVEFFFKKKVGDFTGWLGYTWSKTERRFEEIMDNQYFPAKYDRRHDLSMVATYDLNEHWSFGAAFVYATGNTITLPTSWYLHNGDVMFEFEDRNASRLPDYHRLDLSATWYDAPTKMVEDEETGELIEVKKRFRHNVNFSIYNVYSRQNPFFLFVQNEGSLDQGNFNLNVQQVSLFPILPSITWNFEF
tara:strand:+ start:48046 stop:50457 length:2412 start_codon:yes stop_codon:yes gene_type:complete